MQCEVAAGTIRNLLNITGIKGNAEGEESAATAAGGVTEMGGLVKRVEPLTGEILWVRPDVDVINFELEPEPEPSEASAAGLSFRGGEIRPTIIVSDSDGGGGGGGRNRGVDAAAMEVVAPSSHVTAAEQARLVRQQELLQHEAAAARADAQAEHAAAEAARHAAAMVGEEAAQRAAEAEQRIAAAEERARQAEANAAQKLIDQLLVGASSAAVAPGGLSNLQQQAATAASSGGLHLERGSQSLLNETVRDWVRTLRLGEYEGALSQLATGTDDLLEMCKEDVAELGMKRLEERRFLHALEELKKEAAKKEEKRGGLFT